MLSRNIRIAVKPQLASPRAFSTTTPARYSDLARMTLIGRITADPKRYSDRTGGDFMRYTVATNDPLKAPAKEGDERPAPTTSFHTIFAFGEKNAHYLSNNVRKGDLVRVEANFRVTSKPLIGGGYSANILVSHQEISVLHAPNKRAVEETSIKEQ